MEGVTVNPLCINDDNNRAPVIDLRIFRHLPVKPLAHIATPAPVRLRGLYDRAPFLPDRRKIESPPALIRRRLPRLHVIAEMQATIMPHAR